MLKNEVIVVGGVEGKHCLYCDEWHPKEGFYIPKQPQWSWRCRIQHLNHCKEYHDRLKREGVYDERVVLRMREYSRNYQKRNRSALRKRDLKRFKMVNLFQHAKGRAKKKELPYLITWDDFPNYREIEVCPVMPWIKLNWDNKRQSADSPTIDRISDELGYVPGNVRLICWRANDLKRNGTLQELEAIYRDALLHQK